METHTCHQLNYESSNMNISSTIENHFSIQDKQYKYTLVILKRIQTVVEASLFSILDLIIQFADTKPNTVNWDTFI